MSAITPFLKLLRHTLPTKETTTNPIIDYSRPLIMMSDEYMECDGRKRKEESTCRKCESLEGGIEGYGEAPRGKSSQKAQKKHVDIMWADQRIAKRKFDEAWSTLNCVAVGDALHKEIKENPLIVGYMGRYCGYMPLVCKHKMSIEIEKRRMLKSDLSIEGYNFEGYYLGLQR